MDPGAIERTLAAARARLLAARVAAGHWQGELSSSALATATATCALELFRRGRGDRWASRHGDLPDMIDRGLTWLADHQNEDGGWGDTVGSPSNISTTLLCRAALGVGEQATKKRGHVVEQAEAWLEREAGSLTPARLAQAVASVYGTDRTFSVPILTMCAVAGRFGSGGEAWRCVPALPFELAACPQGWLRRLGLPVVSYALPALIAIGQARHHHRPTGNLLTRWVRDLTRGKTLRVLDSIQPESGGFIEAIPLTSFVVMSLASIGQEDHPVARKGASFLMASVGEEGSWPIDTNLATWVTTLSVKALAGASRPGAGLSLEERSSLRAWLLGQQHRAEHPYTQAAPGGWAWTDLSGGVPDADDTSGALLALRHLAVDDEAGRCNDRDLWEAVEKGLGWLLDLQNKDGGVPTFCRGWGKLRFDQSGPDLTAHALRAWAAWREAAGDGLRQRIDRATTHAVRYLISCQREDGAWLPLWFGNQQAPARQNPVYGTGRVLRAGRVAPADAVTAKAWLRARRRAAGWLLSAQNADGGWGGAASVPSSVEETGVAVEALAFSAARLEGGRAASRRIIEAVERGSTWLVEHTEEGTRFEPAPIGLYFAKLWYGERLYPVIFTVSALEQVRCLGRNGPWPPP